jgi:hypothetical protein
MTKKGHRFSQAPRIWVASVKICHLTVAYMAYCVPPASEMHVAQLASEPIRTQRANYHDMFVDDVFAINLRHTRGLQGSGFDMTMSRSFRTLTVKPDGLRHTAESLYASALFTCPNLRGHRRALFFTHQGFALLK